MLDVFNLLEDIYSKNLLVELINGRIFGFENIKLSRNDESYWKLRKNIKNLNIRGKNFHSSYGTLNYFDLTEKGIPILLICDELNIMEIFCLQQYRYNHNIIIDAKRGDIILDAGGYVGDSALYFAYKVGNTGGVYSFEFIPSLIKIFKKNLNLNPNLKDTIRIVEKPLWNCSSKELFYYDGGGGSKVSLKPIKTSNKLVKSITIDDFVAQNKITHVDFIKMDIEGAEYNALIGAKEVLKKYKPQLSIAIYHNMNHYHQIPRFINSLNLNYKFYLDHFNPHLVETILFAKVN